MTIITKDLQALECRDRSPKFSQLGATAPMSAAVEQDVMSPAMLKQHLEHGCFPIKAVCRVLNHDENSKLNCANAQKRKCIVQLI